MSTALMGSAYSPHSPGAHSPDTTSPVFPDRPIRPLPKRPIRSRLSPEVADSILYPSAPPASTPLFQFPYSFSSPSNGSPQYTNGGSHAHHTCPHCHEEIHSHDDCFDSEDEDGTALSQHFRGAQDPSTPTHPSRPYPGTMPQYQQYVDASVKSANPPAPHSTTSSADGYESFENTNNKKKRKIPTSGSATSPHTHLSAEMANMGLSSREAGPSSPEDSGSGVGQYYGSGYAATSTSGTGISGAGRGRYGRSNGKAPLGVLADSNSRSGARSRNAKTRGPGNGQADSLSPGNDQGIISAAIASAAEKTLQTPVKGQENVSLLQQQSLKKTTPTKSQFTFTCASDSAKSMVWPGQHNPPIAGYSQASAGSLPSGVPSGLPSQSKDVSTQGTQTSPNMDGAGAQQQGHGSNGPSGNGSQQPGQPQPPGQKKPRPRRTGKELALAARQRRLQQEYNNYHHPPSIDEIWVCEFCEYESIFGHPPEALIRQYEIKDRKERRRIAEKRRLLEKAKTKGRKGKKGTKAAAKAPTAPSQQQATTAQNPMPNQPSSQHEGTQSEEYLEDDFDDEPLSANPDFSSTQNEVSGTPKTSATKFQEPAPPDLAASHKQASKGVNNGRNAKSGQVI